MRYKGGKAKDNSGNIGLDIVKTIETLTPSSLFIDMCCGALNVSRHFKGDRIGVDICQPLITTLSAAIAGWDPPERVSKEQWEYYKKYKPVLDPMTGFCMFARSYMGRAWGGFCPDILHRPRGSTEYLGKTARKTTIKKANDCKGMQLYCMPFWAFPDPPAGAIVYCDPPYEGTEDYGTNFDHKLFWDVATYWHYCGAHVYVSEGEKANPPKDWFILKEWKKGSQIKKKERVERLFCHKGIRI